MKLAEFANDLQSYDVDGDLNNNKIGYSKNEIIKANTSLSEVTLDKESSISDTDELDLNNSNHVPYRQSRHLLDGQLHKSKKKLRRTLQLPISGSDSLSLRSFNSEKYMNTVHENTAISFEEFHTSHDTIADESSFDNEQKKLYNRKLNNTESFFSNYYNFTQLSNDHCDADGQNRDQTLSSDKPEHNYDYTGKVRIRLTKGVNSDRYLSALNTDSSVTHNDVVSSTSDVTSYNDETHNNVTQAISGTSPRHINLASSPLEDVITTVESSISVQQGDQLPQTHDVQQLDNAHPINVEDSNMHSIANSYGWAYDYPLVTYTLLFISISLSILTYSRALTINQISFTKNRLITTRLWTPLTSQLWVGEFGFQALWNWYLFKTYLEELEVRHYGRHKKFVYRILLIIGLVALINLLVLKIPLTYIVLQTALNYLWAKLTHTEVIILFMRVRASTMPWLILLLNAMTEVRVGPIGAGIAIGHAIFYVDFVLPTLKK